MSDLDMAGELGESVTEDVSQPRTERKNSWPHRRALARAGALNVVRRRHDQAAPKGPTGPASQQPRTPQTRPPGPWPPPPAQPAAPDTVDLLATVREQTVELWSVPTQTGPADAEPTAAVPTSPTEARPIETAYADVAQTADDAAAHLTVPALGEPTLPERPGSDKTPAEMPGTDTRGDIDTVELGRTGNGRSGASESDRGSDVDASEVDGTAVGRTARGNGTQPGTQRRPASPSRPAPDDAAAEVWALVERAQAGDSQAFAAIYDRYVDTVFRFIYFRVGSKTVAEDLTSDTFLRALKRIGSFTWQGRDLGAWLVTIARNLIADHFKSGRNRFEVSTAEVLDADQADREPESSPETAVVDHLTHVTLLSAVQRLNREQQECIVLRFLQGFSVAETAQAMGKNEGAIKALQYRAVRALHRLLPEGFQP